MNDQGVDIPALARALGWSAADLRLLGDLRDVPPYIEAEIERRGLEDAYVRALLDIVLPDGSTVLAFWKILRATPDQRALAFLRALEPTP